ncbi:MAG: bifunctional DNA primase/polymerase [Methanomicrobiales archaeon]|jgi:hypothetical protein
MTAEEIEQSRERLIAEGLARQPTTTQEAIKQIVNAEPVNILMQADALVKLAEDRLGKKEESPPPAGDPCLAEALEWARKAFRVIPIHNPGEGGLCTCGATTCSSPGKHPRTPNGLKDATTDREIIRGWWQRWPGSNLAIVTGRGLFVVDIDPRHGGSLEALEKAVGTLPKTWTHRTGGGGLHLLYRVPKGTTIPSRVGVLPGIDIKGEGGYILVPPSRHASGNRYERIPSDEFVQDPSDALVRFIIESKSLEVREPLKVPEKIKDGERNSILFRAGCALRAKGMSGKAILAALVEENREKCSPPLGGDEVQRIAESVVRYPEGKKPVGATPPKEDPAASTEKDEKAQKKIKPWLELNGRLYITARNEEGLYFFASRTGDGIEFVSHLEEDGGIITPRTLPIGPDGEDVPVVGIPLRERIEAAHDIDPDELVRRLDEHIKKWVDLTDLDREMGIYYLLFTWFYPKANTVPYYRALGDTGKGKSRIITVLSNLCFFPITASGASTVSGIMRFKEGWRGTLVIDESDLKDGDTTNDLIKYLNLGFERGKYYIKTDKTDPSRQDIFDPFCPKLFGMRHQFTDNATEGRCLSISPIESNRRDLPIVLTKEYDREMEVLRGLIARFALTRWGEVDGEKMVDLHDLGVEPRIQQLAMPLSIVLQLVPDGRDRFMAYVKARQREVQRMRAASWEGTLFNLLVDLALGNSDLPEGFESYRTREGIVQAVTPAMMAKKLGTSPQKITHGLGGIGVETEPTHIYINQGPNEKPARRSIRGLVFLNNSRWVEAARRYRPPAENNDQVSLWDPCPDALRSAKWTESPGTNGTDGTLLQTAPHPPYPSQS